MLKTCCPLCARDAVLMLRLDECETLQCDECGERIDLEELQERVNQWSRLLQIAYAARDVLCNTEPVA